MKLAYGGGKTLNRSRLLLFQEKHCERFYGVRCGKCNRIDLCKDEIEEDLSVPGFSKTLRHVRFELRRENVLLAAKREVREQFLKLDLALR